MSQATALEQYMLELVNRERAAVGAQPLAFNSAINTAADNHSLWMIATDTFSHSGDWGSTPQDRMKDAGYAFTGSWTWGENIAWASLRDPAGYRDEVDLLHKNLMNSAPHKENILKPTFREIGIGFQTGTYQSWDGAFVTQDFATSGSAVFLTGVAFDDKDGDRFYDPGEGLGSLSVRAVGSDGVAHTAATGVGGGYALALASGKYTVTFSGGGYAAKSATVTIDARNVKLDWIDPVAGATAKSLTVSGTSGADVLVGGTVADTLRGYGGNDRIKGYAGADVLIGDAGADTIEGGAGRDRIQGGAGNDILIGGADADLYKFTGLWGADTIRGFEDGLDRLDLRGNGLSFGSLAISQRDLDADGVRDDVFVKAAGGSIGLINVKLAAITAADFLF